MQYGYLTNPNVGVITEAVEPFHHCLSFAVNDPLVEAYETTRGDTRYRIKMEARMWLNANLHGSHRVYPDHRIIVFRHREEAMLFKLVFG